MMKVLMFFTLGAILCSLAVTAPAQTSSTVRTVSGTLSFKVLETPKGADMTRLTALAEAIDFANWPETKTLFAMPDINVALLQDPAAITHSTHSCSQVTFAGTRWDDCKWSWRRLSERKAVRPTKLPADQREQALANLSAEQRKDSQLVASHLKRQLERYQKSRRYRLDGQIDIEVCLTPGSQAAKEFLLNKLTDNMLPTEGLIAAYRNARLAEGPGTTSFANQSRSGDIRQVVFIRNNIFVSIRANGFFAEQALPLARKIDTQIILQPSTTLEGLQRHNTINR